MKLNPDCVRDVLLAVESSSFGERMTLDGLNAKLPQYSTEDLWYTCLKLEEGGYLQLLTMNALRMPMPMIKEIKSMTYFGHEFLDSIREENNWGKVKTVAQKAGAFSLTALGEIAKEGTKTAITAALQSSL